MWGMSKEQLPWQTMPVLGARSHRQRAQAFTDHFRLRPSTAIAAASWHKITLALENIPAARARDSSHHSVVQRIDVRMQKGRRSVWTSLRPCTFQHPHLFWGRGKLSLRLSYEETHGLTEAQGWTMAASESYAECVDRHRGAESGILPSSGGARQRHGRPRGILDFCRLLQGMVFRTRHQSGNDSEVFGDHGPEYTSSKPYRRRNDVIGCKRYAR